MNTALIAGACIAGFVYVIGPDLSLWRYFLAIALLTVGIFAIHEDGT